MGRDCGRGLHWEAQVTVLRGGGEGRCQSVMRMPGRRKGRLGEMVVSEGSWGQGTGRTREASEFESGWHGEAGNVSRAGSQACRQV